MTTSYSVARIQSRKRQKVLSESISSLCALLAKKKREQWEHAFDLPPPLKKHGIEGLKDKLHPARLPHAATPAEIAERSPYTQGELLSLTEVRSINALSGYNKSALLLSGERVREKQFGEMLHLALLGRNITAASIRIEINKFLRKFPPRIEENPEREF
jgi:hypothetical protein